MAIKRSVDVIRAAAAEQRGFAAQIIDPPKLKTKFLEAAGDLERAADRLEQLERDGSRIDWLQHRALGESNLATLDELLGATNWTTLRTAIDNAAAKEKAEV